MKKDGLIPSIEGMRALAVLAVLGFHLDVTGIPGGFLGVDVFFVISGFVITRSIVRQRQEGNFDLWSFYLARIRRLIPALSVVTLATLAVAIFTMPPGDLEAAGQSAVYAGLSLSNFLFWSQANYFDAAAHTKPFLHTWSLGVEEQFYLVWPALLLLIMSNKRALLVVPAALGVLSIVAAGSLVGDHTSAVFFLAPFRVYQFMLGALLAITTWNFQGRTGDVVHAAGLIGLVAAVCTISGDTSPVLAGLAAAVAGGLAIAGRDSGFAQQVTSNRVLIWVGQRSYALYLVHWPLIVLFKYAEGPELSLSEKFGLGLISILLAATLHSFVERPFRKRADAAHGIRSGTAVGATAALVLASLFLAANVWGFRGFPGDQSGDIDLLVANAKADSRLRRQLVRTGVCHAHSKFRLSNYDEKECAALHSTRVNVLVIGDSIAADLYLVLKEAYPQVVFSQATGGTCPPLVGIDRYTGCKEINSFRFDTLAKREYDYVVFAGYWRDNHVELLLQSIGHAELAGGQALVFGPVLEFKEDLVRVVSMSTSVREAQERAGHEVDTKEQLRERIRESVGPERFVDFFDVQCAPQCDIVKGQSLLYLDHIHLSPTGVSTFAKRLAESHPHLFR